MILMLKVTNVVKSFDDTIAVKNLSFELEPGTVLGLIGQNGAGKSTTFKMILNFLKPDSGEIMFDGHHLSESDLDSIGYMPEERGLYLDMTIKQQVLYFAQLHSFSKKAALDSLPYWMDKLSVKGTLNSKIKSLSKGNQQKVQLISSFIHQPKLLILDEPFSGLDPVNTELLINAVRDLQSEGTAIIFSSHDMRNVEKLSDSLLLLVNGNTALQGTIPTVKESFGKTNLYIEGAFTEEEIKSLPGLLRYESDYPGFHLTFDNEESTLSVLNIAKESPLLSGYRLFTPSLDDIFKIITQTKEDSVTNA
ncbi:ATP-binding cassette domain-containing protein [Weissella cibaria]|nr:ATP-binding cassette domain-containing protein [Weissella cibaria]